MANPPTIAVLHLGEMGAALAAMLRGRGKRVVTCVDGRSDLTIRRCHDAGVEILPDLAELTRVSDVVVCVVPPAAAEAVATRYAAQAHLAPKDAIYVDANSIRGELAVALADMIQRAGRAFVDASINGLAARLSISGTMYLSGERSGEVAELFERCIRVRLLGGEPGRASALKMLLAGLSKGVCALFLELGLLARRQGLLDELLQASSEIYPGISALAHRMLPTYARHASRRAMEMNELEQTLRSAGQQPCVVAAVRRLHEPLSRASLDLSAHPHGELLAAMIEQLGGDGFLAAGSPAIDQA